MHLNMGIVEGLDRITQPVVSSFSQFPTSNFNFRTSISSQLGDKSSDAMNILFVTPQMLVRGSRNQTESPEEACDLWKAALSNSSNLEMQLVHGAPARAVTTYPFLVTRFIK